MALLILFPIFLLVVLLVTRNNVKIYSTNMRSLWIIVFAIFMIVMSIIHSKIVNPTVDYFINIDEANLYNSFLELSRLNYSDIITESFTSFEYLDNSIIYCMNAMIIKIMAELGIADGLFSIKTINVFIGSLVPVFIYKCLTIFNAINTQSKRDLILFACLTPLLSNAIQNTRDVHVCLIFTLMMYLSLKQRSIKNYVGMGILVLVGFFVRAESALFSLVFLGVPVIDSLRKKGTFNKIILFSLVIAAVLSFSYLYTFATETISRYYESGTDDAVSSSLSVKMRALPFPFNYIGVVLFALIYPFPLWNSFGRSDLIPFMGSIEIVYPFYIIPIMLALCIFVGTRYSKLDTKKMFLFGIAMLYIFLNCIGQGMVRRLLAVYPILILLYIVWCKDNNSILNLCKKYRKYTFITLFFLHIVYLFLKS